MDLGATICAPRIANCLICPLRRRLRGRARDPLLYPVKAEKPERPTRYGHAFVMRDARWRRLSCARVRPRASWRR